MTRIRLYCSALTVGENTLNQEESHHATVTLRARQGAEVILFDGKGGEASGTIVRVHRRAMLVQADPMSHYPFELSRKITLAVAFPKAHRQGVLIEKCTELGVASICPIITQRSVVKPTTSSIDKWTRRAIEAAKQSNRTWVPQIESPQTFEQSLQHIEPYEAIVMLDIDPSLPSLHSLLLSCKVDSSILIFVGPEGGWTQEEREQAVDAGAVCSSIAPTVLRTETAAIAACAIAASISSKP